VAGNQQLLRCKVHLDSVLAHHPRRWGWICQRCRAAGQPTEQPYPFVPLRRSGVIVRCGLSSRFRLLPVPMLFRR
jgi:hypothetical protein